MGRPKKPKPSAIPSTPDATAAKPEVGPLVGSTSANLHEGSRSEYLAHYVFSCFGTSVPVPRQEDTGLDLYCTLTERVGQRIWPRAYYAVQVKSTPGPWKLEDANSIRWLIEHPLPLFLCVVDKKTTTLSVYHTSPRFHAWAFPPESNRMVMVPGSEGKGSGVAWYRDQWQPEDPDEFDLSAPIAKFTVGEILDDGFRKTLWQILKNWIDVDLDNIDRIRHRLPQFRTIGDYETNVSEVRGYASVGKSYGEGDQLAEILPKLKETLLRLSAHFYATGDSKGALRVELLFHHLDCLNWVSDAARVHNLHSSLNKHFKEHPDAARKNFYAGIEGLSKQLDSMTETALKEAAEAEAKDKADREASEKGERARDSARPDAS